MAHKGPAEHRYINVQVRDWDDHAASLGQPPPHPHTLLAFLRAGSFCSRIPGLVLGGRAAMAEALCWDLSAFDECFAELVHLDLAVADWTTRVVFLPWVLRQDCNRPTSTSTAVAWRKVLADAPECELIAKVTRAVRGLLSGTLLQCFLAGRRVDARQPVGVSAGQPDGLAAHLPARQSASQAAGVPGGVQEQEQEQEQEPPAGSGPVSSIWLNDGLILLRDSSDGRFVLGAAKGIDAESTLGLPRLLWDTLRGIWTEQAPTREAIEKAGRWLAAGGWGFTKAITAQHLARNPGLYDLLLQSAEWKGEPIGKERAPPKPKQMECGMDSEYRTFPHRSRAD